MIDLDELERKEQEATPAPWAADAWNDHEADVHGFSISAGGCLLPLSNGTGELDEAEANAELIAALRNAAPALIAMARRMEWIVEKAIEWDEVEHKAFLIELPTLRGPNVYAAIDAAMQEQKT